MANDALCRADENGCDITLYQQDDYLICKLSSPVPEYRTHAIPLTLRPGEAEREMLGHLTFVRDILGYEVPDHVFDKLGEEVAIC